VIVAPLDDPAVAVLTISCDRAPLLAVHGVSAEPVRMRTAVMRKNILNKILPGWSFILNISQKRF